MGWWCEVRGELTFLIAAPPWLLPSTSQQAGCSCRRQPAERGVVDAAALSHPPHSLCSGRPGALAERPGQTSSRGESVASSLARLAGEQPK